MGQQQLLLIVLGIIIVGISVVIGISVFTANAVETKRNNIINDCITLGALAQQHWKTPAAYGGGNNSFDGSTSAAAKEWKIPGPMTTNANGWFKISDIGVNSLTIIGTGNETVTGNDSVKVSMLITPLNYQATVIN